MSYRGKAAVAAAVVLASAGGAFAQNQKVTGPVADYWMSAATTSGFGMGMMGGGGGRPGIGAMMSGAMNPNAVNKSLTLQLGSSQTPSGAPSAEHLPPAGLGAGPSLPLQTPQRAAPTPQTRPDELPRDFQRPKGRMLIYWGCGDHAPAGQPLVIDFAKIGQGQMPNIPTIQVRTENPASPATVRTYGEWPNERARTTVPGSGSLIGSHTVQGNYSPPIRFDLAPENDFLAPLSITGQTPTAMGGTRLTWGAVPRATGYFAWLMGAGGRGGGDADVVFWSSGSAASFMGQLMDYIPPAEARRLVAANVVMSPQTTSCVIPSEVIAASPQGLLSMIAYGDEVVRVDPPRPNPPAPWNISWRVKVRYKSTTGTMLGMPSMSGGDDERPQRGQRGEQQQQPAKPPSVGRAIGGAILRGGFGF